MCTIGFTWKLIETGVWGLEQSSSRYLTAQSGRSRKVWEKEKVWGVCVVDCGVKLGRGPMSMRKQGAFVSVSAEGFGAVCFAKRKSPSIPQPAKVHWDKVRDKKNKHHREWIFLSKMRAQSIPSLSFMDEMNEDQSTVSRNVEKAGLLEGMPSQHSREGDWMVSGKRRGHVP